MKGSFLMHATQLSSTRKRALTITELAVVIVVTGIVIGPIFYAMSAMNAAERDTMNLMRASSEIEPIKIQFQDVVRDAGGNLRSNLPAFYFTNDRDFVWIYHMETPGLLSTYQPMAVIGHDPSQSLMYIYDFRTSRYRMWKENVVDVDFREAPSNILAGSGDLRWGDYAIDRNGRGLMMSVAVSVGEETLRQDILAFAPNVAPQN